MRGTLPVLIFIGVFRQAWLSYAQTVTIQPVPDPIPVIPDIPNLCRDVECEVGKICRVIVYNSDDTDADDEPSGPRAVCIPDEDVDQEAVDQPCIEARYLFTLLTQGESGLEILQCTSGQTTSGCPARSVCIGTGVCCSGKPEPVADQCPPIEEGHAGICGGPDPACSTNEDCEGGQVCCTNSCGQNLCVNPVAAVVKPEPQPVITIPVYPDLTTLCHTVRCGYGQVCRVTVEDRESRPLPECVDPETLVNPDSQCREGGASYGLLVSESQTPLTCNFGAVGGSFCPLGSYCVFSGNNREEGVCCYGRAKSGHCPAKVSNGNCRGVETECEIDSDCSGELKCCNSCGEKRTCESPTCEECAYGQVCVKTQVYCVTSPCNPIFECRDRYSACAGCRQGTLCVTKPYVNCEYCPLECLYCAFVLPNSKKYEPNNKPTPTCVDAETSRLRCKKSCIFDKECVIVSKVKRRRGRSITEYKAKCIQPRGW